MKQFKKILGLLLAMLLLVCTMTTVMAEDNALKVFVDGKRVFFDVEPQIINDRTMVPLRAIFEELDAEVEWDAATRTVTSVKDDVTVTLTIDDDTMYVNGEAKSLDSPACIVGDRTLVPVRAISEAFELLVRWNGDTRTVIINEVRRINVADEDIVKFVRDAKGNVTYREFSDGRWAKYEYDENGFITYIEEDDGYWEKTTYDEYGNETYIEEVDGIWYRYTYDENGNEVLYENSTGYSCKYSYDEKGNEIYRESSDGAWEKTTYDEKGNVVYVENSDDEWVKYSYNENNKVTLVEYPDDEWTRYTYDEKGNVILMEESDESWIKIGYDENGNIVSYEDSAGNKEEITE